MCPTQLPFPRLTWNILLIRFCRRLHRCLLSSIYSSLPFSLLDLYQLQRKEKEENDSASAASSDQEIYLLSVITTVFLFLFAVFVLVLLRRRRYKTDGILESTHSEQDSNVLLQLLQQQHQNQPDLFRDDREKVQLITRLSNFNANVLDHLVVRNDRLLSNTNSIDSGIATNNNRSPGSQSATTSTPHRQVAVACSVAATTTSEEDADSEPDYAEPIFTSGGPSSLCLANCSPERRPPLPASGPPSSSKSTPHKSSSLDSPREFVARGYFARSRETAFE